MPDGSRLTLRAPVTGVLVPLERVPDPVFARHMVGDGVSLDPLGGRLVAPCDGEVTQVHASHHAVTITHASGVEVLLHVGLDTVSLLGRGFTPHVALGDRVRAGNLLLEFDLDRVASAARSLLTQMVVPTMDLVTQVIPHTGTVREGRDVAAELVLAVRERRPEAGASRRAAVSESILVPNSAGLHARPAALLAALAKRFESKILLQHEGESANAKSLTAILALAVGGGDKVVVSAHGPDAADAVAHLAGALAEGLGEGAGEASAVEGVGVPDGDGVPAPLEAGVFAGVPASPGVAEGTIVQVRRDDVAVPADASDKHEERRLLNAALDRADLHLRALADSLAEQTDASHAGIVAAHAEFLSDPELLDLATSAIDAGRSAPFAWRAAYEAYADRLAGLPNPVLASRAADVRDAGLRVLRELTGHRMGRQDLPLGAILVAEDLTPSDAASLDRTRVAGFATTKGGSSSHVAMLARSLDIPAIAGIDPRVLDLPEGTPAILDGFRGVVRIDPSPDERVRVTERRRRLAERRERELAEAFEPALTTDGRRVGVVANIGSPQDARDATAHGADGVGLLRSEFLFFGRPIAPGEDEQAALYAEVARTLDPGQPLVIRTLDVGGDKRLPYLPMPREENPSLGERGIRVGLARPEILRTQVRAILRAASAGARLRMMFPMIATLRDFRRARELVEGERRSLGVSPVPIGIMVEVPSVALLADRFAEEADFFSIGTNDLTQYTLAMDRGHPKLAPQVDGLDPAVLRLIADAVRAAHERDRWVGICGGLGADPQAVPVLVGLGVDELSVTVPTVPAVKSQVRELSFGQCQELAQRALRCDAAEGVRRLIPAEEM